MPENVLPPEPAPGVPAVPEAAHAEAPSSEPRQTPETAPPPEPEPAVAEATEADALEPLIRLRTGIGNVAELESRHHVAQRRAPWHQALGLEHVAGAPIQAGKRFAEHAHAHKIDSWPAPMKRSSSGCATTSGRCSIDI